LDWYTTFASIDTYKLNLSNAITSSDSFTVSPELQPCKDEYRLGLIDDYNAAVLMKTSINLLISGDFAMSNETIDQVTDNSRSANCHYDNVTYLLESYNTDHQSAPLNLSTHHSITQEDNQSTVNVPAQTTEPAIKTLADKEPEETEGTHVSEETVDNTDTSESTMSADSSTHNIFDYCTWQAETTKNIGEYYKAPENKIYVVVTIKINNTGDQTYTTNPYSWHLKIGDMYYQPDTSTYDSSLNQMTTDIGPGGKITTKIAYLVDEDLSISDMGLYYDGPGSDGTIYS
jgi:Telomeric repeat-binding factor 2.